MDYLENSFPLEDQLRKAMRQWASGIVVVTAEYLGNRHGMTVSSFTSVSVEPPVILVSLHKNTRTHDLVLKSQAFGVTLLAADQQELSDRFAGRIGADDDRFSGVETFTLKTTSPLLTGGLAVFDCRLMDSYDTKTTTVMFGEVVTALLSNRPEEEFRPLLYHNQGYRWLKED
jgi:flavin reductase (DIM6/NTAB) family NADH-FMN oxidoreductase RutF